MILDFTSFTSFVRLTHNAKIHNPEYFATIPLILNVSDRIWAFKGCLCGRPSIRNSLEKLLLEVFFRGTQG